MSLTFAKLKTRAARAANDPTNQTWGTAADPDEWDDYVNDALREFCTLVPVLKSVITLQVAATYDTDRPTAFYRPASGVTVVRFFGAWANGLPLERSTINDEFQCVATWEDVAGTPTRILHGDYDWDIWRVAPMPAAALTSLRAHAARLAAELDDDADIPEIPPMWHPALASRAALIALEKNGEKQDMDAVDRLQRKWDGAIGEALAWVSASGGDEQDLTVPMGIL